jgi:hypothetical protein
MMDTRMRSCGWSATWPTRSHPGDYTVDLAVLDLEHTPYCMATCNSHPSAVLNDEWDHELVLSAMS